MPIHTPSERAKNAKAFRNRNSQPKPESVSGSGTFNVSPEKAPKLTSGGNPSKPVADKVGGYGKPVPIKVGKKVWSDTFNGK